MARALFGLGPVAFVVRHDPVGRVGEPDRAVRLHHHVVGRIQPLALIAVGQHGDAAVGLGPGDPPRAMLAGDQPPLPVAGVAVGEVGRAAEDRHAPRQRVGVQRRMRLFGMSLNSRQPQVVEPDRPFGPAAAGDKLLQSAP